MREYIYFCSFISLPDYTLAVVASVDGQLFNQLFFTVVVINTNYDRKHFIEFSILQYFLQHLMLKSTLISSDRCSHDHE